MSAAKISAEDFIAFNRQLRSLVDSGFPLAEGLGRFSGEVRDAGFGEAVQRVAARLQDGESLSAALEKEGRFSAAYAGLVRAGEETGDLAAALDAALEHERFLARLEQGLRKNLFYPVLVFLWTLVVYTVTVMFAFPTLTRMYAYLGLKMPVSFQAVQAFYGGGGVMVLVWVALVAGLLWWVKRTRGLAGAAILVPGLSGLMTDVYSARIARTLGALLGAGARVDHALAVAAAGTADPTMKKKLLDAGARAGEGQPLSQALAGLGLGRSGLAELARLGEESGKMASVLAAGADLNKVEAEARLELWLRIINVVLIIALGAWVLWLAIGFFATYSGLPAGAI